MKLFRNKLLSETQLKKLGEHQYQCQSVSILDNILQPYWSWLVLKVPIWLAPNSITILGLFINIITALILVWFSPDAKTEPPRWACGLCALGLFIYQSLDAIDGKQARRTGTANPLGELFDHGCDSISTVFVALSACIAVQLGHHPGWMFFQCFCAVTLFYCAHWQTYVSGTLRFGKVDVTEAQFTIMAILMVSTIFGPSVWSKKFFGDTFELWYLIPMGTLACGFITLNSSLTVVFTGGVGKNGSTVAVSLFGLKVPCTHVMCTVFYLGYLQVFLSFLERLKVGGSGKNGSTVATDIKWKHTLAESSIGNATRIITCVGTSVLSPVIPFSMVLLPAFIIYQKSIQDIYQNHPSLYILSFGLVAAKVTNRLVVAHMTKSEMEYTDWSLVGPAMLFLNQYFNTFVDEYYILWLCMVWVSIDLIRYCHQICEEICDYLHVELFRIPYLSGSSKISSPGSSVATETNGTNNRLNRIQKSRNKSKHF